MQHASHAASLELEQDAEAQRREWRFERGGWVTIALVVAAALAGLFGDGPLAHAARRTTDGRAALEYDRVVRYGTSSSLSLTLPPSADRDTMATVSLDEGFLEAASVEEVTPQPVETRASATEVEYHFRRTAAGQRLRVEFAVKGTSVGVRHAHFGTPAGPIGIRQFVLP